MRYTPKHGATKAKISSSLSKKAAGVALLSAAAVGGGVINASSADAYTPYNVWDKVAACESNGNWAINTGNGYYGGLQFAYTSWRGFGGLKYAAYAHQATREQQIIVAQAILKKQGPRAWPVCSKRAGLTRANGGAVVVGGQGGGTTPPPPSRGGDRKLAVDGVIGPQTTKAIQKWVGVSQSGSFNVQTKKALQRKVGTAADGVIGPKSVAALQKKLGIPRDGARSLNARTVKSLQSFLNAKVL